MSCFFNHSQNLGSGFMLNCSIQLSEAQGIKIEFLALCAVNSAPYLCNSDFSHW